MQIINITSYFIHLRPKSWAVVALHMSVGYFLAITPDLWKHQLDLLLLAVIVWAMFLNGGTLAYNSAFDNDKGDIGYLDNPPPAPKHLAIFGFVWMFVGLIFSWFISKNFFIVTMICFIMSILYSSPPIRLKAVPGLDLLINSLGYGGFTMFAGYAAVSDTIDTTIITYTIGFACLLASLYPVTQIYQYEEDKRNGDRTFTVVLGKKMALYISFTMSIVAHIIFIGILLPNKGICAFIILISFLVWFIILFLWIRNVNDYQEKKGMYRILWAWALTDISIVSLRLF